MLLAKILFWLCMIAIPFHGWGFVRASRRRDTRKEVGYLVMLLVCCIVGFVLGVWVIK